MSLKDFDLYSLIPPESVPLLVKTAMSLLLAVVVFTKLVKPIFFGSKSANAIEEKVTKLKESNLEKAVTLKVLEENNRLLDEAKNEY